MKELICKCGAVVPDESIYFCESVNLDGDDIGQSGFECNDCSKTYYLVGWVLSDTIEEAKEWLMDDTNWSES